MTLNRLFQLPRQELTVGRLLHAVWRRFTAVPDSISYRLEAGPGSSNFDLIRSMQDVHRGERCFILGNGPSLARMDLGLLRGQPSIGLNRIFLLFKQQPFRPTYYVCMNGLVLEQSADSIRQLDMPRFLNWRYRHLFSGDGPSIYLLESFMSVFSGNLTSGVWGGATVTFVALQVAFHLGFEDVVLIGVDHRYSATGTPHTTVEEQGPDPDHFAADYFPPGFKWQLPDLRTSEIAYRMARQAYEAAGRRIVDATPGGDLQVFDKVDFREVV
jgi:hypothetical protein